ncbi:MAG: tyrosine-type recombinase/integrase, partial [Myxococcales bacterium]|nr:tyrosine-type recombinase/integrase [Myxococcales bacterium]
RRYELTCSSTRGFILRVLPTGKKVFFVRYVENGVDRRERLGLCGAELSVEEARELALRILAENKERNDTSDGTRTTGPTLAEPPEEPPPRRSSAAIERPLRHRGALRKRGPLLREVAARYLQDHVDIYLKPGTAQRYRALLRERILPALGRRRIDGLKRVDVERLHRSLAEMPTTANHAVRVLSSLLTKAIDWGLLEGPNPAARVRKFRERKVERFLTPEERQRLEDVLARGEATPRGERGYISPSAIAAIRLLSLTGMRRNEVIDLRWKMVDWRNQCLHLPDSKTGQKTVPLSGPSLEILRRLAQAPHHENGLVMPSLGGGRLTSINQTWLRIRTAARLHDVRIHDLRHSAASDAIMAGVPLHLVGAMLGHKSAQTTERYVHISNKALRDAVNRAGQAIARAAGWSHEE